MKIEMIPEYMWIIAYPIKAKTGTKGVPLLNTMSRSRHGTVETFLSREQRNHTWDYYYRRGFRCKRVVIKELGT